MELPDVLSSLHVRERLSFVGALLDMMAVPDPVAVQALTGGAAMWAGAVDQTLESANPLIDGASYKTRRSQEAGGQALIGLRLARNEIAHGEALVMTHGVSFPMEFPMSFELKFVGAVQLVALGAARGKPGPRALHLSHYEKHVATRAPRQVLSEVYRWLEELVSAG